LVAGLSIVPIAGVFTLSRIFYVRDLALFFRSRHLWLRHVVFSGQLPFWDPYMGAGQSAVADALNQLLMPVTLAIRLLPPDVVALQALSGEPVTFAASLAVTVAYVASRRPAAVGIIAGALVAGVLLASVQLVPLVLAGVRAHRAALQTPDFWSLHPLMLYET